MERPTHDEVRSAALNVLRFCPQGVKQSELWKQVERSMISSYDIDQSLIKNALWDLPDILPESVTKVKKSNKNVILFPTKELLDTVSFDLEEGASEDIIYDDEVYEDTLEDEARSMFIAVARDFFSVYRKMEETMLFPQARLFTNYAKELTHEHVKAAVLLEKAVTDMQVVFDLCEPLYRKEYPGRWGS
ncbi:hypothetical protein MKX41_02205 [Paenibacillus sp. FSL R5-0475]|uniref:hypothetical protein n=1 Tax=Paenibacillus sp. FSL R5-0475 TaxID=2921643 RepID=UPI0030F6E5BF